MFLTGMCYAKLKGGYYPITLINFGERYFMVFTNSGKEKISFKDITSMSINSNVPITVMPE